MKPSPQKGSFFFEFFDFHFSHQILGCGNIVIRSSATCRAGLVLNDVDHVEEIYAAIENSR